MSETTTSAREVPVRPGLVSSDGPLRGYGPVGIVVCLILAMIHLIATRLVWGEIPLQTDTGIWAYFAARMLDGARLYGDLWESKPPGIFWTFAAVVRVFGVGEDRALLWLDAVVTVAVCGVTYAVARRFASRGAAVVAVCLLSVVMCHRVLADWGNNLEKFVALFEMTALWLVIRKRSSRWLLVGLTCGLAAIYKQTGVLLLVILLVGLAIRWRGINEPRRVKAIVQLLVGATIPWIVVLIWLLRNEALADFWRQVVVHDVQRATSADLERSRLLEYDHWANVGRHLLLAGVVLFPAIVGVFAAFRLRGDVRGVVTRDPRPAGTPAATAGTLVATAGTQDSAIVAVYALLATFVFFIAPHGYGHYLLQAAPPAAVLAAMAFDRAWSRGGSIAGARIPSRTIQSLVVIAILLGLWQLGDHFRFTFDAQYLPRQAYELMSDRTQRLVRVTEEQSAPGQTIMHWPANHAVSYYADRRTPLEMCQAIDIFHGRVRLLDPPLEEVIRRIEARPPDLIVDWTPVGVEPSDPDDPNSPPVLIVPAGGFSLAEEPNPEHPHLEGRLLSPLKTWMRSHYGGQVHYRELCTVYALGQPWRDWREYLRADQVRSVE